ncbi:MAG: hypothetical protein ABDH28_00710 [Brevinematia bacterium]
MIIEMEGRIPIYGGKKKLLIDYYRKRIREEAPEEGLLLFALYRDEVKDRKWLKVDNVQVAKVRDEVKIAMVIKDGKIYFYEIDDKGVFWWYEW